jgi:hypothetical protein
MGYVLVRYATPGQELDVDIRGRVARAQVVTPPFYKRVTSRSDPSTPMQSGLRAGPAEERSQSP